MPLDPLVKLVGIARSAATGAILEEKRRVEYRTLPTRRWLNRCTSRRVPFHWTINPYRGCEFGCKYCYARYTHEFLERRAPDAFETEIYVKDFDVGSFRKELASVKPGQIVGLGTATDPYQPAERRFGRTRQVLESMVDTLRGISVCVTTKSDLAGRDAAVLNRIAQNNAVVVTVSIITLNPNLARLVEPYAPRPDLRLEAIRKLASAGVSVGVLASPILPFLTDSRENLQSVATAAKDAGAESFFAGALFLKPSAQRVFFPFLAEQFPHYLRLYRLTYRDGAFLRGSYAEQLGQMVRDIRDHAGLTAHRLRYVAPPSTPSTQLCLF